MVLDRNPQNYFAEIEQLAFAPSHLIPGTSSIHISILLSLRGFLTNSACAIYIADFQESSHHQIRCYKQGSSVTQTHTDTDWVSQQTLSSACGDTHRRLIPRFPHPIGRQCDSEPFLCAATHILSKRQSPLIRYFLPVSLDKSIRTMEQAQTIKASLSIAHSPPPSRILR